MRFGSLRYRICGDLRPLGRRRQLSVMLHFRAKSLPESLDTETSTGRMVFTVLGAIAELERSLIVERVKGGSAKRASKGQAPRQATQDFGHRQNCALAGAGDGLETDRR